MNIKNADNYVNSFWDWTFLNEAFVPTNIRMSDIEGIVERKGNVLFVETKRRGEEITLGQKILYDALVAQGHTVFYVIGNPNEEPIKVIIKWQKKTFTYESISLLSFRYYVKRWFSWANKNPYSTETLCSQIE